MKEKRIVSFLPSATELIYELGAEERLFGVTHECNYPNDASNKPRVIESVFDPKKMSSQEIDNKICSLSEKGEDIYKLVVDNLKDAHPYMKRSTMTPPSNLKSEFGIFFIYFILNLIKYLA